MRAWKNFIKISCLLIFILGYQSVEAQQDLAQQAYAIIENNCLICHGTHGPYTENLVIQDRAQLIATGTVIPGNPDGSEFYKRLIEDTAEKPRMPWGQPPLSQMRRLPRFNNGLPQAHPTGPSSTTSTSLQPIRC